MLKPETFRAQTRKSEAIKHNFSGDDPGEPPALAPVGTPFQRAVWDELLAIPYGKTTTYGEIARRLSARSGHAESPRAVGSAVGRNPILVMVPCHRVVGASGSLTGYAAGIGRKERLLGLEGATMPGRGARGRSGGGRPGPKDAAGRRGVGPGCEASRPPRAGMPDPDACYAAYAAKDPKFDGLFFIGVRSTGIYCRATCTAKTPRRENCEFFPTAAAAEAAGYRPCMRCRPELAPGTPASPLAMDVARRAAVRLRDGSDHPSVAGVATELGVSERHLRRLFEDEYGTTPSQYRSTCRLLLAKELLTDTDVPVAQVAYAAGYDSVRRLNDELRQRYGLTPTDLRCSAGRAGDTHGTVGGITLRVGYRPPFQWDVLLRFLAGRAIPGVESVADGRYARSLRLRDADGAERTGWVSVSNDGRRNVLECLVSPSLMGCLPAVLATVSRIFDTACSPEVVWDGLDGFRQKAGERYDLPGVRLPGCADPFEMACRAILGQQITVGAASTIAGRVARKFRIPVDTPFEGVSLAFPPAADVAGRDGGELGELGVTRQKQRAILSLASGMADGSLRLEAGVDPEETRGALVSLPGIGEWTAQYLLMRACQYPDAMPSTDYAVTKAFPGLSPRRISRLSEAWRPWRSYAVMSLWQAPEA